MDGGASTIAAQQAIIAEATKASGVIVSVDPREFLQIVELNPEPLVVSAEYGIFGKKFQYLTSYRGLAFFTKASTPLVLPADCEVVRAKKIWVPG